MRLQKLFLLFSLLSASCLFAFAGGDGSSTSPYQVSTVIELQNIETCPDSNFILINDIDATETQSWNGGDGFVPIGGTTNPFSGTFDGQGHTISNLYINIPGGNNRAMFSYVDGATISNVMLSNFDIAGDSRAAALVGYLNNSTVTCCGASGQVSADSGGGGLIGRINASTVIACFSVVDVTGRNTGENFGGLAGIAENASTISNCYARGDVNGYNRVGGLVGKLDDSDIAYSYSTGEVTSTDVDFGGLVGVVVDTCAVSSCFWDMETSLQDSSLVGTGETTEQMTYFYMYHGTGWDFAYERLNGMNNYWDMDLDGIYNDGYPYLAWQDGDAHSLSKPAGNGSLESPYLIADLHDLFWVTVNSSEWDIDHYYKQTADIDASDTRNWNNGEGYRPLGLVTIFRGHYDGADHQIDSLYINRQDTYNMGFVGTLGGGGIHNLRLTNVYIDGYVNVGGVAGSLRSNAIVDHCSVSGYISGGSYVGGIAGFVVINSQIRLSHSDVDASATFNLGGICGYTDDHVTIDNCYCTGSVTGNGYIGGCVGRLNTDTSISNCYSLTAVDANYNDGGFLGAGAGTVTNCFWDTETSGYETSHAGTGLTTAEMQTMATYTDAGWDFAGEAANGTEDIWLYLPGDYPVFCFDYDAPDIIHANDVAGDQGHQIELLWNRCDLDTFSSPDNYYTVWRLVESTRAIGTDAIIITDPADFHTTQTAQHTPVILHDRDDYWTYLQMVPGMYYSQYAVVLPTLVDSCATLTQDEYEATYRICYHFESGYLTSDDASGYSVDNIPPFPTRNVHAVVNTGSRNPSMTLHWDEVTEGGLHGNSYPEQNGVWYRVYGGDTADFACNDAALIATTQGTTLSVDIAGQAKRFFKVVVSDQP